MFTKAELTLIEELREQKAPLERWAKFFPQAKIVELMEEPKPLYYWWGNPMYTMDFSHFRTPGERIPNPCSELPCDPKAYAASMKRGNIYMWDDMQDAFLASRANTGCSIKEMISAIKYYFGIERTTGAIESRLSSLGFILR